MSADTRNMILAIVLMISTAFVLANLFVDIALVILDPRIRAAGVGGL